MTEQTSSGEKFQMQAQQKSFWDTAEKISKTLSIAAIPIVLAIGGWLIQKRLQDQTLRRDYVQLAVTVLKEPGSNDDMKKWAVNLLSVNSPVPFTQKIQTDLSSGEIKIPEKFEVTPATIVPAVDTSANSGNAGDWELKGLEALFNRDADTALEAFKNAEKKFPTFHNVHEIRKLLEEKRGELNAPKEGQSDVWKSLYRTVHDKYSFGLSAEIMRKLAEQINKP